MTTTIYYFSGTGNSLKVAQDMAAQLGNTHIIPMSIELKKETISAYSDTIGFVFPVYCWGLPRIVIDFIHKFELDPKKYYFALATGGSSVGNTLVQFNSLLKRKKAKLSAGYLIVMPGNYIPLYGAKSEEKQNLMFQKANKKIASIAKIIKTKKKKRAQRNFFLFNLITKLFYKASIKAFPKLDKFYNVDDKCSGCGICTKICPVENIKLINMKPKWNSNCEQCLACLQWCPEEAIQYNKITSTRKRYHHPQVQWQDLKKAY
ncbi:EFR1 family ferrodoxin [Candidatus Margulisiibacteriota bacterium]